MIKQIVPTDDTPMYVTTPIKAVPTMVTPSGILQPIQTAAIVPPAPDLTHESVIPTLIRPSNISDQAWAVMQSQGAAKIASQQVVANQVADQTLINAGIATAAAQNLGNAGTDAPASLNQAAQLANTMSGKDANVQAEIASQVIRAAEAARAAAALPTAKPADIAAAVAAEIISTQAIADAAAAQHLVAVDNQVHAENAADVLLDKSKTSNDIEDQKAATEALQRLHDANQALMVAQQQKDQANAVAAETLAKSQSDAAALALAALIPKASTPVVKIGWFDKIINYIYNNLYK
jgi:hypothetical protein